MLLTAVYTIISYTFVLYTGISKTFLNSKKQANLCKDPWAGSLVVQGWRLALGSLLGLEDLICCEGEAARIVLQTKNSQVITDEGFGGKRALGILLKSELCQKRSKFRI